jgi:ubiquitin-protein ligase
VSPSQGPADTPYAGGFFLVVIEIPSDYPFKPLAVQFVTDIWHPQVLVPLMELTCIPDFPVHRVHSKWKLLIHDSIIIVYQIVSHSWNAHTTDHVRVPSCNKKNWHPLINALKVPFVIFFILFSDNF